MFKLYDRILLDDMGLETLSCIILNTSQYFWNICKHFREREGVWLFRDLVLCFGFFFFLKVSPKWLVERESMMLIKTVLIKQ